MRSPALVVVASIVASAGLLACDRDGASPTASQEPPSASVDPCVARAEAAARTLGKALKTRLLASLANGPEAALRTCAEEAQTIHRRVAEETGVRVGRTATKLRNPANADAPQWVWAYLRQHGAHPMPAPLLREREGAQARALLPLGAGGVCQTCHGAAVSPRVREAIAERYPGDEAVGFGSEELRGVLWAEADCE